MLLIDISGSMSRYSRMLLQFAQRLASGEAAAGRRISVFVFGTRLSPITRQLAGRVYCGYSRSPPHSALNDSSLALRSSPCASGSLRN